MKKYILISISAFALSHSAFAQNNQSQHYPTKQNCNIHLHKGNPNYSHYKMCLMGNMKSQQQQQQQQQKPQKPRYQPPPEQPNQQPQLYEAINVKNTINLGNFRLTNLIPKGFIEAPKGGPVIHQPGGYYSSLGANGTTRGAYSLGVPHDDTLLSHFSARLQVPKEYLVIIKEGNGETALVNLRTDNDWYPANKHRFPQNSYQY